MKWAKDKLPKAGNPGIGKAFGNATVDDVYRRVL